MHARPSGREPFTDISYQMLFNDRIKDDETVESISREEMLRHWLEKEVHENDGDDLAVDAIEDEDRLLEELIDRKPIAESIFADSDLRWHHLDLQEDELEALHTIKGESGEDWRAITEENTIASIADHIHEADDLDELDTPKDLEQVVDFASKFPDDIEMEELIAVEEADEDPYLADGNHRAVAIALHRRDGGAYPEQEAYVGASADQLGS
jgi:hypothetical protein